ncbi:hypothetical protein ACHAWF_003427 [Thalassiosira exigua]
MDDLQNARKRFKAALDEHEKVLKDRLQKIESKENSIEARLEALYRKKIEIAEANGDINASDDDLIEVNAGGKIVSAKRSTFTLMKGTRLEALFSGRWDKKLQRDHKGRIFLDVHPAGFRAIVDHLNEVAISSEESVPKSPRIDERHKNILRHQMELFGLQTTNLPDSEIIIDTIEEKVCLHNWLKEEDSDGDFTLLYRGSRDGISSESFHSKCDGKGCTSTIIETTEGFVLGGYSNTPWSSTFMKVSAPSAFLFVISGFPTPWKMKLKNKEDTDALYM